MILRPSHARPGASPTARSVLLCHSIRSAKVLLPLSPMICCGDGGEDAAHVYLICVQGRMKVLFDIIDA